MGEKERCQRSLLSGPASWERALEAGRLTKEGRNVVRRCERVQELGRVCAPVNTHVINETEEVTRLCVTPDDVSG